MSELTDINGNYGMKKQAFDTPLDVIVMSKTMGTSLKVARQRREMTQSDVALRIGVGREVVMNVEKGKSIASHTLFAMLWLYGLLGQMVASVSDEKDVVGLSRERSRLPQRVRKVMDNEF